MAERVTRERQESVRCPRCLAKPGVRCRDARDARLRRPEDYPHTRIRWPHRERRKAYLDKQAGEARGSEET